MTQPTIDQEIADVTEPAVVPRLVVLRFADAMEEKLRANEHKGTWKNDRVWGLLSRCYEELDELRHALLRDEPTEVIRGEAADVANFAMMIADVRGAL